MSQPSLSDAHRTLLRGGSAIADEVIAARGYFTATHARDLAALGFATQQCRAPGLVIPLWTPRGEIAYHVLRPDHPRVFDDKRRPLGDGTCKQKVLKYELPKGARMRLDCPPPCRAALGDPAVPLWITEGQKKADSLASRGQCAVALLGVWNWRGRNDAGGATALADWDDIALNGRQVILAFDSDAATKPGVQAALKRLTAFLQGRHAYVDALYLPHAPGAKTGIDDYFAAGHTAADARGLLESPRALPQPALPTLRLLDRPPATLDRPLQLIELETGGYGFAATWLYVEVTQTEGRDKQGELVRYAAPVVETQRRLFAVRDDGKVFGAEGAVGVPRLDEIGLRVHLPQVPPDDRLWSAAGVTRFLRGERPDPVDALRRVAATFDRFIDFDRSLATQEEMCEMAACYVLASYLLDAFTVTGYLWPTGERGSGKTQFLTLVSELGFLGHLLQMGGSFASLRDLSDYGALLCFDDAENLADARIDPDKRTLLLAGNRKGCVVTLKELGPDRNWVQRQVRTFTPRCFSAISRPDPVLASRAILAPLVRTSDRRRANADALDYTLWPHNRRRLIDDLWAVGLAHVGQLSRYAGRVGDEVGLVGRSLEPWRTILAVALWLEEHGAAGLYARMTAMAVRYQEERKVLEQDDLTTLVIEAVARVAARDGAAPTPRDNICNVANTGFESDTRLIYCATKTIADEVRVLMDERELALDPERVTPRYIGPILSGLRFKHGYSGRKRAWAIRAAELDSLLRAYGLNETRKECQIMSVGNVADVVGADRAAPPPLPHPLWTPELRAECADPWTRAEPFHEEREDAQPLDRDPADLRAARPGAAAALERPAEDAFVTDRLAEL